MRDSIDGSGVTATFTGLSRPLPKKAKTDKVKAELSDEMLKVSLPVVEVKKLVW